MTQPAASGPDQFDPATFTVVEHRTFEDLKVGDIFRAPGRTLTDAHATAFQAVSEPSDPLQRRIRPQPWPHRAGRSRPAGAGIHGARSDPVPAVHRRRLHRLHQPLVQIPRRGPCRRHALSATGDHRSGPARRRRSGDDPGNHPQPARPVGARRRAHLPAEDSAAEHIGGRVTTASAATSSDPTLRAISATTPRHFIAYAGPFSVDVGNGTVTHRVDVSLFPSRQGHDQVRRVTIEGGRLSIIASDRISADGRTFHSELIWLRV